MSTPDFSHITARNQLQETTRYTFYAIDGEPWVDVVRADDSNKTFFNAVLKRNRRQARGRGGNLTTPQLNQIRHEDRRLYARHIVKEWGNVTDTQGNLVPFSVENCEAFLRAVPDWIFDDLRDFCVDPESFKVDIPDDETDWHPENETELDPGKN